MRKHVPVVAAIAAVAILSAVGQPAFLNPTNLLNILVQSTIPAVVGFGMTYVMIAGGIDLSVGSTVACSSIVLGVSLGSGMPAVPAIIASLLTGAAVGLANGLLVNRVGLAPFLATLGTMGIARGGAFLLSGGEPISGVAGSLRVLFRTPGSIIPVSVYVMVVLLLLGSLTLKFTAFGRRLYAIGSNERAAILAGLKVGGHRTATYVVAGVMAALGGGFITARLDSAQPLAGSLYELDAIAAVVIGGGSLSGGRGDLIGTLLGVILIVELRNAVTIIGLPTHAQPLVIGALLIVAVSMDARRQRSDLRRRGA